jgi:hypothetical protein
MNLLSADIGGVSLFVDLSSHSSCRPNRSIERPQQIARIAPRKKQSHAVDMRSQ